MTRMFCKAIMFNQPLSSWNVSNVRNFASMFEDAKSFQQNLDSWNVQDTEYTVDMFKGATAMEQIPSWLPSR